MSIENKSLVQAARKLSDAIEAKYEGRWCFFAGFAFLLDGVEKRTNDIDVLTKDPETFQHIAKVLLKIGAELVSSTNNFSSYKIPVDEQSSATELTLDLLCIENEFLRPLRGMWEELDKKRIDGSLLPVASPLHLILLKVLVNFHRQSGDRKKEQDLADVKQLMSIRGITPEQVSDEARIQGIKDIADQFLKKINELSTATQDVKATALVRLRKMAEADIEIVSDLAMLANPFADKERYAKFIASQIREFPELTVVAVTESDNQVVGYFTADSEGDEACIEDIAVAPSWQKKGVGKSLFTESIRLLEKRKVRLIKVEVHYKCSSAIPFYYSFGFRFASCVRDRFGKGEDAITLTKNIP